MYWEKSTRNVLRRQTQSIQQTNLDQRIVDFNQTGKLLFRCPLIIYFHKGWNAPGRQSKSGKHYINVSIYSRIYVIDIKSNQRFNLRCYRRRSYRQIWILPDQNVIPWKGVFVVCFLGPRLGLGGKLCSLSIYSLSSSVIISKDGPEKDV